nr:immunoglobulin light chain junction region [Macaca mulatta]
CQQNSNWPLSF